MLVRCKIKGERRSSVYMCLRLFAPSSRERCQPRSGTLQEKVTLSQKWKSEGKEFVFRHLCFLFSARNGEERRKGRKKPPFPVKAENSDFSGNYKVSLPLHEALLFSGARNAEENGVYTNAFSKVLRGEKCRN